MGTFIRKTPKLKPFEFEKFEELYQTFVARYEELKAIRKQLERFGVAFVDKYQSNSYKEFEKACMLITPRQAAIVKVLLLLYENEEKRKFYELKKQKERESKMSTQIELEPVKSITLATALIDLKIPKSRSNAENYRRTVEKLLRGRVEGKSYTRGSPEIRKLIGKVEGKSLYFPIGFLGEITHLNFFLKKACQNIEDMLNSLTEETELVIDLYSRLLTFSLKIEDLKREKESIVSLPNFESFSSAIRHKHPKVSEEEIREAYIRAQEIVKALQRFMEAWKEFEGAWIRSKAEDGIKPLVELSEKQTLKFKKRELTRDEYERRIRLLKDIAKKVLMEKKRNIANIKMTIQREFPM